jgi:hypothetical protein
MRCLAMIAAFVMYATALQAAPVMTYGAGAATSCGTWLSGRVHGVVDAGQLHAGFLAVKSSDTYGRAKQPARRLHTASRAAHAKPPLLTFRKGG